MRILIVQTAFLGDIVLILPLVQALRQQFPQAAIDILTVPGQAPLLQGQPGIQTVLVYDKRGSQHGLGGLRRLRRQLRLRHYDLALAPHRSVRTALLLAWSGIPIRVGFKRWMTFWAYTATVSRPANRHEVERNMSLLTRLNGLDAVVPTPPALSITAAARQQAQAAFAHYGVSSGETVIGIIPGSQWGTKRWPAEGFADLIMRLASGGSGRIALFGGPQDRAIAQAIIGQCAIPVLDFVGHTPLATLPAYLERCVLVISNDTGPMHVAAAVGTPVVVLYGPTTAALGFAPYGVPWEEASVSLPCRPCHAHGPQHCPLSHWRCMHDLSADQVAAAVQRLQQRLQRL